jgi:prepilin-type N-terminal cleavage/methylation domain-containing protein
MTAGDLTQRRRGSSPTAARARPQALDGASAGVGLRAARRAGVRRTAPRGFTLVEGFLVLAILGILAAIAINEFKVQVMLAKRTEAIAGLSQLWAAQQVHYSETGIYAGAFSSLAWEVAGGTRLSPTSYKGGRYTYQLSQPWGSTSYYCIATANLDQDAWPDILEVYEFGQ